MKHNIFKIVAMATVITFSSTSCSNLLDIKETDFLGGDVALRTVENNQALLIGTYGGFGLEMGIRLNGVFSDELKVGEFYNAQSTHEWQYSTEDVTIRDDYNALDQYYRIVDRINRMFVALPNATASGPADEALRKKLRGEGLFLRAFAHFELFRYFCKNYDPAALGLAYMSEPSLETKEREKQDTYFKKILDDITEAKTLLDNSNTDVYRANRMAVVALHARVALYMRNWKDAITYSTEYINAYPLASKTDFPLIWTDKSNAETAFKLSRSGTARVGSIYRGLFTKTAGGVLVAPTTVSWISSDKLWNSYDATNDIRFGIYLKEEPILKAIVGKPYKLVNKYRGGGYAESNENVNDLKVFRTGEMVLIRAEARAEDGIVSGANSAATDLNALRAARINGYVDATFASKEAVIAAVIDERFKELAFEGHRFFDLKRRGLPVVRTGTDAPSATGATLPANNFRFVLPIPSSETLANPKIQQNEGYF